MLNNIKKLAVFLVFSGLSISVFIYTYAFVIFDRKIPSEFAQFLLYDFLYGSAIPGKVILIGFILYIVAFIIDCIRTYKNFKNHTK